MEILLYVEDFLAINDKFSLSIILFIERKENLADCATKKYFQM